MNRLMDSLKNEKGKNWHKIYASVCGVYFLNIKSKRRIYINIYIYIC